MARGEDQGSRPGLPRVLVVIKCLGYGGAERLVVDMMAARDREVIDYEVAFVLSAEHALVPAIEAEGVRVHDLGARHNGDLRWLLTFRRLLRSGHFDVVHFHLPYAAALGRLVTASLDPRTRPAVVYTEHSLWDKTAGPVKALNRIAIGRDDALVAVSRAAYDALPGSIRPRAQVVVHGVDLTRSAAVVAGRVKLRAEVRRELGIGDDQLVVMTVANLRQEKGYDVFLEAARIVSDHDKAVRFVAIGRGPLEAELTRRRDQLGLGDSFTFLGQRDDVLRLLSCADVFVLASHHEGLPVSLMEATSVGLPMVASAVGGIPGALEDGVDALLVPPGRPDALAQAIERLGADEILRRELGESARRRSVDFDIASAVTRMETLYRRLSAEHRTVAADEPLVLHVIPTPTGRGAQREARALADQLDSAGKRRHRVLCLFDGSQDVIPDVTLALDFGNRPAAGFDPRVLRRLRAALRELDPAVVVAHGGDPFKFVAAASVGRRRRPLVYYAIGTYAGAHRRRIQVELWRSLARRADVVAACGPEVRQECETFLKVPAARIVEVANGRDPDLFAPRPRRPDGRVPVLVFVGALAETKRPGRFIDLVRALRTAGHRFDAQLIGDGPLLETVRGPAQEAGVDVLGPRSDVPALLGQADVLVFPSVAAGEGIPGILIEAGLCAVPVVAGAVPGVGTVVQDGETGLVVGIEDFDALVSATATLLDDPERRGEMGRAARRFCVDHFSVAVVAGRWEELFDSMIRGR